jgi:hypothetical protein
MKLARFVTAAVLALTTSAAAQAQATLKFQPKAPNPAITAFGYYVGPFWGTITSDPTKPVIDLYCVDVLNQINWGHTWTANVTNLGSSDMSKTRQPTKKANYQQAAYLASMFNTGGVTTASWGGIQAAMWQLLNPGHPNGGANVASTTSEAYWLNKASTWYNSPSAQNFDFSQWTIVTQTTAAGHRQGYGTQEFLTTGVTPEPETWVLMGTGLFLVVGFALKRGRLV